MNRALTALLVFVWMAIAGTAYPAKDITLVNSFPVTGPMDITGSVAVNRVLRIMQNHAAPALTDILAWHLRQSLSAALDTPVTLERRARRRMLEGHEYVANAAADGRTLLFAGNGTIVIAPYAAGSPPFEPLERLTGVASVARMPMVLIAARHSGMTSAQRLIEEGRTRSTRLYLGSSGELTTAHLAVRLFARMSGTAYQHVAFNGAAAAARAALAEQVIAAFVPLPALLPYAENPRIRALAITDGQRHPALASVPTVGEIGLAGFEVVGWYGLFAPADTPLSVIAHINASMSSALQSLPMQRLLAGLGLQAAYLPGPPFMEFLRAEQQRWKPLIAVPAEG